MRNRQGSVLTLATQRTKADIDVDRGFCDGLLVGPEPRVAFGRVMDSVMTTHTSKRFGKVFNLAGSMTHPEFDYLAVEILRPSRDGINGITMTGGDSIGGTNQPTGNPYVTNPRGFNNKNNAFNNYGNTTTSNNQNTM